MAAADAPLLPKLAIEKFADGKIACLKFTGTIDESFEGGKLGASVGRVDILVLDLGGVRKISSFGIREWVDFVTAAGKQAGELVLIECSPKVVDQLNMVANFTGGGRVSSFYAPFRCDYCESEQRVLLEVSRDFETIKSMKLADRRCLSCKEMMYFDDDGTTFFSYVAGQGPFELDAAVLAFLAAKLDYRTGTVDQKIRVDKVIEGRLTYLRLAGALDQTFPRDKLADGVEGTVILDIAAIPRVEPVGAAEWRGFVQQVTPIVERLLIVGATPAFLERLAGPSDLGTKGAVVDCALPFVCSACGTTTTPTVPCGELAEVRCPSCKAACTCTASEQVQATVRRLPRLDLGKDLDRHLAALRARKLEKKASTGIGALPRPVEKRASPLPYIAGVLALAAAAGGAIYLLRSQKHHDSGPYGIGPVVDRSAPSRPGWLAADVAPGKAACTWSAGAVSCISVSQPSPSQDDAEDDASDAAIAVIVRGLDDVIAKKDASWGRLVPALWEPAMGATVGAFERDAKSTQARRELHDRRRAVTRSLGVIDPSNLGRYWEAFQAADGRRFVAFAHVALDAPSLAKLVEGYTHQTTAAGATVVSFFPGLAWRYPQLSRGAVIEHLEPGLVQQLGIAEGYIVLAIDGRDIPDADGFAKVLDEEVAQLTEHGGPLRLLVQAGTGEPREFSITFPGKPVVIEQQTHVHGPHTGGEPTGPINVWDRAGGNHGSGRDDPTQ